MSTSSNAGPLARAQDRDWLSDRDKSIIGQAYQLIGVQRPAVRAGCSVTVVSYADTAHACAEALSQATKVIGELLAIIERLADGGAGVTMDGEWGEPSARSQPESGGQAEVIRASSALAAGEITRIRPRAYEITFNGQAGHVLRTAFDDCALTVGSATTTLRAQLPDQAALWGLVQRIIGLGLEVVDLHLVAPE